MEIQHSDGHQSSGGAVRGLGRRLLAQSALGVAGGSRTRKHPQQPAETRKVFIGPARSANAEQAIAGQRTTH